MEINSKTNFKKIKVYQNGQKFYRCFEKRFVYLKNNCKIQWKQGIALMTLI